MKDLHVVWILLIMSIFVSCSKEEDLQNNLTNEFEFDGKNYVIKDGIFVDFGSDVSYNHCEIVLTDAAITEGVDRFKNSSYIIVFEISAPGNSFSAGTFQLNGIEENKVTLIFDTNNDDEFDDDDLFYNSVSGTVKVTGTVGNLSISFNADLEKNSLEDLPGDDFKISGSFSSILKSEIRIPEVEISCNLESSIYDNQVFVDLQPDTCEVVHTNSNDEWHLGFETNPSGTHVILNSSNLMRIVRTGQSSFDDVIGFDNDIVWRYDLSDGNLDSTAIGNWFTILGNDTIYSNQVFLLASNDGLNYNVFKKFKLTSVNSTKYHLQVANIDGTNFQEMTIEKDLSVKFVRISFNNDGYVVYQPKADEWDILFSQYATTLFDIDGTAAPFNVRGVLLNESGVRVAVDSLMTFDSITIDQIDNMEFSDSRDAIGYEWKYYDEGEYKMNTKLTYVIRDMEGLYYKLKFIDYYNEQGQKGYPRFVFQKL